MIKFEVVKEYEDKNINLPVRATSTSAGYDIEAAEDIVVYPYNASIVDELLTDNYHRVAMVPTGIKAKMSKDVVLQIHVRSSVGTKKLLMLPNQTGIIDADYYNNENNEGHIFIPLINLGTSVQHIKKGEKIAQGIFMNYLTTDDDNTTAVTRTGGFGSTSINK